MTRYTYEMSKWVSEMSYENIPKEIVCKAKDQLLNLFGAMFAGYTAGPGNIIAETVRSWGGEPRATVVGSDYKTSTINAALVNSALAQALDYDDWVCRTHAGVAVVPTALAVAEGENLGGKDLLTAQIIGNEIVGRVGEAIHRGRAFGNGLPVHPVESALVAGRLMRLNVSQLTDAIGISCFFATQFPLIGWVSPAKALLTSFPIMHGIMGAEFARRGLKGYPRMLEHPLGYLHSVSERVDSTHLTEGLGKKWITEKLVFKPYPSMGFSQVLIDCALEITNKHCIDPDNVEEVILRGPSLLPLIERWYKGGTNLFELIRRGEWSYVTLTVEFFYPIAAAIVDKELTPKQFVRERILDARIQKLYKRIRCEIDPQLDKMYAERDFRLGVGGGEVEIRLKDGKAYKKRADRMRGHPENLEDTFRVEDKFKAEASGIIGEERVAKVIDLVRKLEKVTDLKRLTKILTK